MPLRPKRRSEQMLEFHHYHQRLTLLSPNGLVRSWSRKMQISSLHVCFGRALASISLFIELDRIGLVVQVEVGDTRGAAQKV